MYRWVEHTAEIELLIEEEDEASVFATATRAIGELLGADEDSHAAAEAHLSETAKDRPAPLAAWIEELVYLAEVDGLIPLRATRIDASEHAVEAEVDFARGDPPHLIKAVTYHRLTFHRHWDQTWHATVILDV